MTILSRFQLEVHPIVIIPSFIFKTLLCRTFSRGGLLGINVWVLPVEPRTLRGDLSRGL